MGRRQRHRLLLVAPSATGLRPVRSYEPYCTMHTLMPMGHRQEAKVMGAASASVAHMFNWPTFMGCVFGRCSATSRVSVMVCTLPAHLARAHTSWAAPTMCVTPLRLAGSRPCCRRYCLVHNGQNGRVLLQERRCAQVRPAQGGNADSA